MKKLLGRLVVFLVLSAFVITTTEAQTSADAFQLYQAGDHQGSAELYEQVFQQGKGTATDHYNAACSWALAGNKDKAFEQLGTAIEKGFLNDDHIATDKDLSSLRDDPRWRPMMEDLKARVAVAEADYDQELKAELEDILKKDQYLRQMVDSIRSNYGMGSPEWEDLMTRMQVQDDENLARLEKIIDQHGWPAKSLVGPRANTAAFLVIQHSTKETMEKYLPVLRAAAEKGEASKQNLALLEDRVRMLNGEPQLYGSQLRMNEETQQMELYEIHDEANVDQRRAEMGLGPLKEYLKYFGMEYEGPGE